MVNAPGARARMSAIPLLALLAVALVGINLRGPIAAVAPVLQEMIADLGLSAWTAGLLTSLPVLMFALLAPAASGLGRRLSPGRTIAVSVVVITLGLVVRVLGGSTMLLVGTVVMGLGMTIGNVMMPVLIKRDFGRQAATVTGIYTATLAGGAALAAALTAPVSDLGGGWRFGLTSWLVLPVLTLVVWWVAVVRREPGEPVGAELHAPATAYLDASTRPRTGVWRHPVAWALGIFLACQSMLYHSLTSWLPSLLGDELALTRETAGTALSIFQVLGIPATLVIPALCRRGRSQVWLGLVVGAGWTVTAAGLLVLPGLWLLWCIVGGLVQGAGISLAFTLVVLRSHDADTVRRLSAMSQAVGYGLGATGPVIVGALSEATRGWSMSLAFLVVVGVLLTVTAAAAGRNHPVR